MEAEPGRPTLIVGGVEESIETYAGWAREMGHAVVTATDSDAADRIHDGIDDGIHDGSDDRIGAALIDRQTTASASDLTHRIRGRDPSCPVGVFTVRDPDETTFDDAFDLLVSKPVRRAELGEAIEVLFEMRDRDPADRGPVTLAEATAPDDPIRSLVDTIEETFGEDPGTSE